MSGIDALTKDTVAQGYWVKRVVAYIIDWILVTVVFTIVAFVTVLPFLVLSGPGFFYAAFGGLFGVLSGVILFLYFLFSEMSMGTSIGKSVMGLKVTAGGGRRPTVAESAIRNISKIHGLLLLLDVIVGLATSKGYTQKYSDAFAKTNVVAA